jgi:hypothetical protein
MQGVSETVRARDATRRVLPDQVVILVFPGGNALLQPLGHPASPGPRLRGITRIAVLRFDLATVAQLGRGQELGRGSAALRRPEPRRQALSRHRDLRSPARALIPLFPRFPEVWRG